MEAYGCRCLRRAAAGDRPDARCLPAEQMETLRHIVIHLRRRGRPAAAARSVRLLRMHQRLFQQWMKGRRLQRLVNALDLKLHVMLQVHQ